MTLVLVASMRVAMKNLKKENKKKKMKKMKKMPEAQMKTMVAADLTLMIRRFRGQI